MVLRNISSRAVVLRDTPGNQYSIAAYSDTTLADSLWSDSVFRQWLRYRIRDIEVSEGFDATGKLNFGSPYDTNLYRSAVNTLKTDSSFIVTGYTFLSGGTRYGLVTKTGTYTATVNDTVILADGTGGAFTITLPAANAASGQRLYVKKIDASANAITISRAGADNIDGGTTTALAAQYNFTTLISDGTSKWYKFS